VIDSHIHLWGTEVAGADWLAGDGVTPAALKVALDAMGPGRLMIGSNWPVSSLRAPLDVELGALVALLDPLPGTEREKVLAGTAVDSCRLAL
jgi:L-fuconolactonase